MIGRAGLAGCLVLAGCAFHAGAPGDDHPTTTIVDDTMADFAAGAASELVVDPLGQLAPEAYALGGLHARGYGKSGITSTTTWADVLALDLGKVLGERYA